MTPAELRAALVRERLLAIVRGPDPDRLVDCLRALADGGIRLAELSLTSPGALRALQQASDELGDRLAIGAGTVLTCDQATRALDAGARFLVTPAAAEGSDAALATGVPVLIGALTPSEVWAAHSTGATAVKLFPASFGGPGYLRALSDPFPDVPLVPVGGIDAAAATAFLSAGALAVGVGSPLLGDAVTGGDLQALVERARAFREAVR